MAKAIAIADANEFYVSCESVFDARLRGRPVVVLSNNDGCIISRSREARALNLTMGAPLFKVREIVEANDVAVFSSNYALYGDTTARKLRDADHRWVRRRMTVVGARIVEELRGVSCLPLEKCPQARKSVTCSRSFGVLVESLEEMREAVAVYTTKAAERLRRSRRYTTCLSEVLRVA